VVVDGFRISVVRADSRKVRLLDVERIEGGEAVPAPAAKAPPDTPGS
jgi:hypothetical protein